MYLSDLILILVVIGLVYYSYRKKNNKSKKGIVALHSEKNLSQNNEVMLFYLMKRVEEFTSDEISQLITVDVNKKITELSATGPVDTEYHLSDDILIVVLRY